MYYLLGKKLTHSFSKKIHEYLGNNDYELLSILENDLPYFIKKKNYRGLNITIPYKETTLKYVDKLYGVSEDIGVINTIVNKDNQIIGYNTDYYAFKKMIENNNIDFVDRKVLILGTGATSKTVYKVCQDLNAKEIYFVSRNKKNYLSYSQAQNIDANIIINTTPYGMYPNIEKKSLLDLNKFISLEACIDVIYNPLKTPLLIEAKKKGIKYISGLEMLVLQAYFSHQLFFNVVDLDIDNVYERIFLENYNLVIIGMPSSGKSTIGKLVAERLNLKFVDIDQEIEKRVNLQICDYIKLFGEEKFRKIEEEVIEEVSRLKGYIISLGGGSLISENNQNNLMTNGLMIYLNRSLNFLKENINLNIRPLLEKKEDLDILLIKREQTYLKCADIIIDSNGSKEDTVEEIIAKIKQKPCI